MQARNFGSALRGGPAWPTTSGKVSNERRTSRSSPAPWIAGWLAKTCSVKVVPERGRPNTNTGRSELDPASCKRAKNAAAELLQQHVDELLVLGGRIVTTLLIQFQRQGIGLPQAIRRPREITPRIEHVGHAEQHASPRPVADILVGDAFFDGGQVFVGEFAAQQRREARMRQRELRLQSNRLA